jgi:hypothetical protein
MCDVAHSRHFDLPFVVIQHARYPQPSVTAWP